MRTRIVVLVFFMGLIQPSEAQSYKLSAGLRGGFSNGITIKYFTGESKAVEGIFTRRYRGYTITGIYEIHKATKEENLYWYYGIGAHIATYNSYYYYGYNRFNTYTYKGVVYKGYYSEPVTVIGADAILGMEYRFKEIPFTVGVDIKPYFDIIGGGDSFFDTALSLRYIIK